MNFDYLSYPYASQRMTTFAKNGMVATSQPLAAQAGLDILKKGGNAIDAAIATAAALTVVEPTSNGIGGDAFALVWVKDKLYGLNASGPAPASISIDAVKERGHEEIPKYGWIPVTVPGVPAAWAALSKRFGKLPLADVLQPAIDYAENGYPVSPTLGKYWNHAAKAFKKMLTGDEFKPWFDTFTPGGEAPKIGGMWRSSGHASTLRSIGETNGESFYRGELAEKIAAYSKQYDGFLSADDLANYKVEWVDPISVNYRGYDVWEIPPNGQGLIALQALNIVKGYEFAESESTARYHKQIEAMKLAFADGQKYITEQSKMSVSVEQILSDAYADERRALIGDEALTPEPGTPPKGGTVYLATADSEGNMVSFIQSNYMGFGSGLVVPGTGIALQNRGHNFSLDPEHDNSLEPGKRTYHTIIPGFLTKNNEAVGPFGVMGGFMQPQGHMQVVMNTVDFAMNPQAALDAPRWQWMEGKKILVEHHFPQHIAQALARKGHDIQVALDSGAFGRGQIIWRDPETGVLAGGTESRTDGSVAAY
ncbi:gamma-glutamyltransferase family protein [Bacillus sp. HMF5848]|uniref:gamma-glutamyltransferase family protein n=1 Tax=Bacillus sp. HMF5848 TaxID=2495421 RepID=UPI000F7AC009|nr:gamma-glutamyltransferase family protein [Bacillus sp. HMF5848]RSK28919.1 gamma-glutamyltransferase family protein [Bacillus sp. HMF5848]